MNGQIYTKNGKVETTATVWLALPRSSASITESLSQQIAQLQPANSRMMIPWSLPPRNCMFLGVHAQGKALARAALGMIFNGDCYSTNETGGARFGISTPGTSVSIPWWNWSWRRVGGLPTRVIFISEKGWFLEIYLQLIFYFQSVRTCSARDMSGWYVLVALRWLQYSNCLIGCVIGVFLEKRPILHIGDDSYGARMR